MNTSELMAKGKFYGKLYYTSSLKNLWVMQNLNKKMFKILDN